MDPLNNDSDEYTEGEDEEEEPPPDLTISSYTIREDSSGDAIVFGEVENDDSSGAEYVKVTLTLYNDSGGVIGSDFSYTNPSTIPKSKAYPFKIWTDVPRSSVDSVKLKVEWSRTSSDNPEKNLSVINVTETTDFEGCTKLIGEIKNSGSSSLEYCEAIAVFYDSDGNVEYNDDTYSSPSTVPGGDQCSFEMYTDIKPAEYTSYNLFAISSSNY